MATIMTIDDSTTIRKMVSMTAKISGYAVVEAEHGQDALDKLQTCGKIDLFICDVNMPIMDGITCVKKIRTLPQYRSTPIIMLTTENEDAKKQEGKLAGATGWVVKPFEQQSMLKIIERLI
jgi:two-component system, chemotaxis family, chemotaxis protein CheY